MQVYRSGGLETLSRVFDVEPGGSRLSVSSSSEEEEEEEAPFTCCAVCRLVSLLYCSLHI